MDLPFSKEDVERLVRKLKIPVKIWSPKVIVTAFAIGVILLGIGSAIVIRDAGQEKNTTVQADVTLSQTQEETHGANENDFESDILFAFTDDSDRSIHLLCMLHAETVSGEIKIKYLSPLERVDINNNVVSIQRHYIKGGITELIWSVEELTGIQTDRYIILNEADFLEMMKDHDDIEMDIDEEVSHDYKGISFKIDAGQQKMKKDIFLKYIVYLCDSYPNKNEKLTEVISSFVPEYITGDENSTLREKYDSVINFVSSDISPMDITDFGGSFKSFIKDDGKLNIVAD